MGRESALRIIREWLEPGRYLPVHAHDDGVDDERMREARDRYNYAEHVYPVGIWL